MSTGKKDGHPFRKREFRRSPRKLSGFRGLGCSGTRCRLSHDDVERYREIYDLSEIVP